VIIIETDDGGQIRHEGVGFPPSVSESTSERSNLFTTKDIGQTTHESGLAASGVGSNTDENWLYQIEYKESQWLGFSVKSYGNVDEVVSHLLSPGFKAISRALPVECPYLTFIGLPMKAFGANPYTVVDKRETTLTENFMMAYNDRQTQTKL
jgi:hypothetical protein